LTLFFLALFPGFIFFFCRFPTQNVDVNVHPTKKEVNFLFEEIFLEHLSSNLRSLLRGSNESRSFTCQSILLPENLVMEQNILEPKQQTLIVESKAKADVPAPFFVMENISGSSSSKKRKSEESDLVSKPVSAAPNKMIRIDPKIQKISLFLEGRPTTSSSQGAACQCCPPDALFCVECVPAQEPSSIRSIKLPPLKRTSCGLFSVETLIKGLENNCDSSSREILRDCQWIGLIDRDFGLVQHKTKLILFDFSACLKQLFYQLILFQFGEVEEVNLSQPISLLEAVQCGLRNDQFLPLDNHEEAESTEETEGKNHREIARKIVKLLISKGPMLQDYFRIGISEEGFLTSLPDLLPGFQPDLVELPAFLVKLALETDWKDEMACFHSVSLILSELFTNVPLALSETESPRTSLKAANFLMETKLFPALRAYLFPQRISSMGAMPAQAMHFIEISSLENLYKTFERC
jgi:DNA mismatch repair protein MLH1